MVIIQTDSCKKSLKWGVMLRIRACMIFIIKSVTSLSDGF